MSRESRFLAEEVIPELLGRLCATSRVFAPVRASKTVVAMRAYKDGSPLALDRLADLSLKEILLPQTERLLTYQYKKNLEDLARTDLEVREILEAPATLVFGARPCDARAITLMDAVFTGGQWEDPYYVARREATTVVSILCADPAETCFCSSVGGDPAGREGADLVLTPVTGGYVAEAVTAKGETLLGDEVFAPAADKAGEAEEVREKMNLKVEVDLDDMPSHLSELFDSNFWEKVTAKCISCGACTFLCPTCYCFNITDEGAGLEGERIRTWDSCMFYHYTLEASGHNPRPTKAERYRNRIGHKFDYMPSRYDGQYGCTGCGRCIRGCPVSLDIRQVLREAKTRA